MKKNIMNVGSTTFMFFALCLTLIVTACGDLEDILKKLEKDDSLPRVQTDKIKVLRFLGEKEGSDVRIEVHISFDKEVVVEDKSYPIIKFRIIGSPLERSARFSTFSISEPKTLVFVHWPKNETEREKITKGTHIRLGDFYFRYGYIVDAESGGRLPEKNNIRDSILSIDEGVAGSRTTMTMKKSLVERADVYKLKSVVIMSSPKNGKIYEKDERIKIQVTFQEELNKDNEAELKRSGVALLEVDENGIGGKSYLLGAYGNLRLDNKKSNGGKVYNFKYKVNSPRTITLPEGIPSIDFGATVRCRSSFCRPTISFENEE